MRGWRARKNIIKARFAQFFVRNFKYFCTSKYSPTPLAEILCPPLGGGGCPLCPPTQITPLPSGLFRVWQKQEIDNPFFHYMFVQIVYGLEILGGAGRWAGGGGRAPRFFLLFVHKIKPDCNSIAFNYKVSSWSPFFYMTYFNSDSKNKYLKEINQRQSRSSVENIFFLGCSL